MNGKVITGGKQNFLMDGTESREAKPFLCEIKGGWGIILFFFPSFSYVCLNNVALVKKMTINL